MPLRQHATALRKEQQMASRMAHRHEHCVQEQRDEGREAKRGHLGCAEMARSMRRKEVRPFRDREAGSGQELRAFQEQ